MIDATHDPANEQPGAESQEAPPIQATCGLCGAPLVEGCDDIYAELCATCELRELKRRHSRGRRRGAAVRRDLGDYSGGQNG